MPSTRGPILSHIKLLVGLCNQEKEYKRTRHNVGFWFIEKLALRYKIKFEYSEVVNGFIGAWGDRYLLLANTGMNQIRPHQICAVYDEIYLEPGEIYYANNIGHKGHKGYHHMSKKLGKAMTQLRIGVGQPAEGVDLIRYVLGEPPAEDQAEIYLAIEKAIQLFC